MDRKKGDKSKAKIEIQRVREIGRERKRVTRRYCEIADKYVKQKEK